MNQRLYHARQTLFLVLPDWARDRIRSPRPATHGEADRALADLAEIAIGHAEGVTSPLVPHHPELQEERAFCPLCRQGSQGGRGPRGYLVPEGLRRHLLGESGAQHCHVMREVNSEWRERINRF